MINIANVLVTVLGLLVGFFYKTIMSRIDKLEENSRKDDNDIKVLLNNTENRTRYEIDARIKNITDLHSKVEHNTERVQDKYENVLNRIGRLEGIEEGNN